MKNTSTRYANPMNAFPALTLFLTILGSIGFWINEYTPVFTASIQDKIPSTQALLHWVTTY